MGYRDHKLLFSDSQTVTAEASDYNLDTEVTYPGWEKGGPLAAVVTVETAATGTTGFKIYVCHKATASPTITDSDLCCVWAPVANLVKGAEIVIPLPQGIPIMRYVGLYFDRITGDESMVVSAYLTTYPISQQ